MASRSTNTFSEFLERLIQDLGQAKLIADTDLPFLLNIEAQLIQKYREGTSIPGMEQAGMVPPGQGPMPPGMGGGMSPPPSGPSFVGEGMPGLQTQPAAPNADELRRLLSQGA